MAEPEAGDSPKRLPADYYRLFAASAISNIGDGVAIIAYPWLASAVTRSGLLISLVVLVQRLPWLLFSLPAGVIADRVDRIRLMWAANGARTVLSLVVTIAVFVRSDRLPTPAQIDLGVVDGTDWPIYLLLLAATLCLGIAEVLYDNTSQTIMPSLVESDQLEQANGRLWATEQVLNTLIGPVLGAALLAIAFAVPFALDTVTFAASAVLIASMRVRSKPNSGVEPAPWQDDLRVGLRWLWHHPFLRPLALILGMINMLATLSTSALVLFGQEVLNTSPVEFALMSTGGAAGGAIAGWYASKVTDRIGPGPSLWLTIIVGGVTMVISGLTSSWIVVWVMFALMMFVAVLWNVITVSLRQTIIPDELMGRVNSVYRFFGWGMMSIGPLLAGLTILVTEQVADRELALRMPWLVAGVAHIAVIAYAGPRLTNETIAAAKEAVPATPGDLTATDG